MLASTCRLLLINKACPTLLRSLLVYQVNHSPNMPSCACNKVKMNVKPNANTKNYNMVDDEQVAVSSSSSSHTLALVNVNSSTPTFKAQ